MSESSSAKPLSPNAILSLLRALSVGDRVELQPEHFAAFDAAIEALAFQRQVRQMLNAPQATHALPRRPAEPRKDARDARPMRPTTPPTPKTPQPPRPSHGAGAIWTPEEAERLRAQWERGDAIGAIAEQHQRSAAACFARLVRIGAIHESAAIAAANFLIKSQQLVAKSNIESWQDRAVEMGFVDQPAPQTGSRAPKP